MRRLLGGLIVLAGIAFLLLLFSWLKPAEPVANEMAANTDVQGEQQAQQAAEQLRAAKPSTPSETAAAKPRIVIEKGHRVSGPEVIRVKQGAAVTVEFLSDQSAELHLHGYDHHLHLQANKVAQLALVAEHSGRFEYELHGKAQGAHHALGVIEVTPQ